MVLGLFLWKLYSAIFDYAINDKTKTRIVSRNNQTAFLTKYLKAYGGSGIYGDQKIGRVLRNIIFLEKV